MSSLTLFYLFHSGYQNTMLSEIRDRATGWIAYIIIAIIIIPFAFWGVNQYFSGGKDVVVATVNGTDIEQADYRRALDNRRARMRQILGDKFAPELADSPALKRDVLEGMVSRLLLVEHASDQGYWIGDKQLAHAIQSNPRFQVNGKFSPEGYRRVVARLGMTPKGFEAQFRQQLLLQQLTAGISQSAFVSPDQRKRLLRLSLQKRQFDYAVVEAKGFVDEVEVTADELQKEYQKNREQYRTPEQLKVAYVELSADQLASKVSITDAEVKSAYQAHKDRYTTDPVRKASHILIQVAPDASQQTQQKALAKAQMILDKLRAGADFTKLAKQYSDDVGSVSDGGDLGRIVPGTMVKPFEEALGSLDKVGQLAGPVKTRFGYHIIKLTGYQPADTKPLSEARDKIVEELRARRAESMFLDRAQTFRNLSYEQPQSLEPVAKQLGLTIEHSGWFTREKGSGIASNPAIREAAFSEEVYGEQLNSRAIELNMNTLVVLHKLDARPASVKPLAEVRGDIEAQLKMSAAQNRVAALGPKLVAKLKSGAAWQSILDQYGITGRRVTWSHVNPPPQPPLARTVINAIFQAPRPTDEHPVPGGVPLPNGNFALFRLIAVIEEDPSQASDELVKRIDTSIESRRGRGLVSQFIADLRQQAEVKVNDKAL